MKKCAPLADGMDQSKEIMIIAALWAVFALLVVALVLACNIWWQWSYCGTPLARCAPAQVEQCERVDDVLAEWRALEALAIKSPASGQGGNKDAKN